MATELFILFHPDGTLGTPGTIFGPQPMKVLARQTGQFGEFVIAKAAGYKTWAGLASTEYEPARVYVFHVDGPSPEYSDGRLAAHIEWEQPAGRGRAMNDKAFVVARDCMQGKKPCRLAARKAVLVASEEPIDEEREYLVAELKRLERITKGCRPTMHEPDEQGLDAGVTGDRFDNAGVENELTVTLTRDGQSADFNLATIVALARFARIPMRLG